MFAKNNRGQVTVFILIGLVLLLAVTVYLIARSESQLVLTVDEAAPALDFVEVTEHMRYCLKSVSEDAVVLNGIKGGLYNPELYVFGFIRPPVTTFYIEGDIVAPLKEQVAYSIGLEFMELMPYCLDEFNGTSEKLTYDAEDASITVRIIENEVVLRGEYPMMSENDGKTQTYTQFSHTVKNVRLFTILDLATELSYIQQADPEYICVTCTVEMADQHFMYIDFTDIGANKTVYTFTDLFSSINDEPYIFMMAHEH